VLVGSRRGLRGGPASGCEAITISTGVRSERETAARTGSASASTVPPPACGNDDQPNAHPLRTYACHRDDNVGDRRSGNRPQACGRQPERATRESSHSRNPRNLSASVVADPGCCSWLATHRSGSRRLGSQPAIGAEVWSARRRPLLFDPVVGSCGVVRTTRWGCYASSYICRNAGRSTGQDTPENWHQDGNE
jgi:hypothetical protein